MTASDIQISLKMNLGNPILDVASRGILDVAERPILDMSLREVEPRTGEGITLVQGIQGTGPDALVADQGTISAVLRNIDGSYTVDDPTTKVPGFEEGLGVVLELSQGAVINRTRGRIQYISPDASLFRRQGTEIIAYDWMLEAEKTRPSVIPVQFWKRDDQLLDLLVANMPNPPIATSFDLGADEYPYSLHTFQDEDAFGIGVMQAIAQSGLGRIYVRSDDSYGETLVYENRHRRIEEDTAVITISDQMRDVKVVRDPLNRARKVIVHFNPVRVDSLATSRLFQLPRQIVLEPGQVQEIPIRYTDPLSPDTRVSGQNFSAEFSFSSISGQGDDLHDELAFVGGIEYGANAAVAFARNDADVTGFLWQLDVFGRGIYLYNRDKREAVNPDLKIGREIDFVMPFNASAQHAQHVADELMERWGSKISEVKGVTFDAARNAALADAMLQGNIGVRINLQETKTNLNADFHIQGRTIGPIAHANKVPVAWVVTPAFAGVKGWILQHAGRSELADAGGENGTAILWL